MASDASVIRKKTTFKEFKGKVLPKLRDHLGRNLHYFDGFNFGSTNSIEEDSDGVDTTVPGGDSNYLYEDLKGEHRRAPDP